MSTAPTINVVTPPSTGTAATKPTPGGVKRPVVAPTPAPSVGRRNDDWDMSFHKAIQARRSQPFAWSVNDCCTWVADHIKTVTGVDLYTEFRGTYTDAKSAFVSIHRITGKKTVEDVADYVFGKAGIPELMNTNHASRGDIVCFDQVQTDGKSEPILGVVNLCGQVALFVSQSGLQRIPVSQCRRAWRVGGVHHSKKALKVQNG